MKSFWLSFSMLASFVPACTAGGSVQPAPRGGQLTFAIQAEPKTFDSIRTIDEPSHLIRYLTGGVLIRFNRQLQRNEPELALSWKFSDAGRSLTFRLREGIAFSNGSPFGAQDVCFTFQRMMDPAILGPFADNFEISRGKTTCKVEGDHLVTLHFPVVITAVERLFDEVAIQSSSGGKPEAAVLGPFVVSDHKPGSYLILARNPRYWKKDENGVSLPYLDSIRIEIQRNRDLELLRFRRGELQIVNNLEPELFDRVRSEMPGAVRDLGPSVDAEFMWFNLVPGSPLPPNKKEWFKNREFRLAVSSAIRREDLIRVVYRGHATAAAGAISPANRVWRNSALRPVVGDPAAALERLRKCGFQMNAGTLRDRDGQPVEFSIITNAGNKSRERTAAMIQQDLKAIGIRVSIVTLDFPSLIERITKTFNYELCLLGRIHSDMDPNSEAGAWMSSGPLHQWNPNQKAPATDWEAEIDSLVTAQVGMSDPAKRKAAFDRIQGIIAEQAPCIYLTYRNTLLGASAKLGNFEPVPIWPQTVWNVERIFLRP